MGRKTLLFIVITVLILMCQSLCAREYQPMVQEGKQWTYYYTNAYDELNFHYRIDGDTIIDGEKWYKLYEDAVNQWTGDVIVRKHYVGTVTSTWRLATRLLRAIGRWQTSKVSMHSEPRANALH